MRLLAVPKRMAVFVIKKAVGERSSYAFARYKQWNFIMGVFFDTSEMPKDTPPSGIMWFIYIGFAILIWLVFVWNAAFIPAMLPPDARVFLVEIARNFPGPNGRFVSLIEHKYQGIAENYSIYFSVNLLFFIGFFVLSLPVFWNDKKTFVILKRSTNMGIKILVSWGVVVAVLFIMKSIDYEPEVPLLNYEIHKGSAYYWVDLVGWIGLFGVSAIFASNLILVLRQHIWRNI